jgi:hypothetical protein
MAAMQAEGAFGYRAVLGHPGQLDIVQEEAAVVRRIFLAYAAGRPSREIAHDLNREVSARREANDGTRPLSTATASGVLASS